jgi:hypothetical protein
MYEKAVSSVDEAIAKFGAEHGVVLPETAYALPLVYAFTAEKMKTLADLKSMLDTIKEMIVTKKERNTFSHQVSVRHLPAKLSKP